MNVINRLGICAAIAGLVAAGCGSAPEATEELGQNRSAVVGTDTFLYFRSNATGWGVDENTRLLPFAGVFARLVNVTEPWQVTDGDTAIVTETNQLDGWGTSQVFSGVASKLVVEPETDALVDQPQGGDAHFKVKYTAVGPHRAVLDTNSSPRTITIQPVTCSCPSPTHCVIGLNSQPNCVL